MSLRIDIARAEDVPDLVALYKELDPAEPGLDIETGAARLAALSAIAGSAVLVGREADAAVSTVTLIVIPNLTKGGQPYALIENVVTAARARGRGHGTTLLKAATERAWAAGCYKVMLMTGSSNPATLAFYSRAGFEQSKTGFQIRRIDKRREG